MQSTYTDYVQQMRKIADITNAIAVLSWDNEIYLPDAGGPLRAQQISTLAGLVHEEFTSAPMGRMLKNLTGQKLSFKQSKNIHWTYRDFRRDKKFTADFVMKKSLVVSQSYHAWIEAKKKNDFAVFAPSLDKLMGVVREEAGILGFKHHPYDAHIDIYEPGMSVKRLDVIFEQVKSRLIPIIPGVRKITKIKAPFLTAKYPKDLQWKFGLALLEGMGYNFKKGRQDISAHPFTISFGTDDVRVTTRIDEKDFANMTWSCIHEGGHALYEQGLDGKEYGLPSGSAASLGIHESQSRLWENNVGRSKEFWQFYLPVLKKFFPQNLRSVNLDTFYKAINMVKPGKIRTEADELHYHLHVLIRYEIEKMIFESNIKAKDLKEIWNSKYKEYIGVDIKNDKEGILQDVHWSHGSFGYFPTYSLGSFYAAQFHYAIQKVAPNLDDHFAKGDYSDISNWLSKNIYRYGKTYTAEELCKKATGETLNFDYFMKYVTQKYGLI
ncbi:MAG: carboxypeptidase M32 [Saprospiraceae bacterium]|nr:carboxypeptidase M32 [Saprospiraceae bacterium]